jgi:hypothetical protein
MVYFKKLLFAQGAGLVYVLVIHPNVSSNKAGHVARAVYIRGLRVYIRGHVKLV